jgi:type I restriction enzyme S subunit
VKPGLATKNWTKGKLQDLVFFQRGFDITQSRQTEGTVPVISSSGVTSYHNEARAVGPGIVIGRKGTIGSVHYSEGDYWPHDTTLWSKDLRGNNPRFVYFYLHTVNFKRFDVGNSNPTLNRNHIHDLPTLIPPPDTQKRIADLLADYDDLIENNRRRMALLEEAARQLYREWFVRLRFPGHEHTHIANGLPEGWERRSLASCVTFRSGGTPSKARAEYWEGDIPWVSSGEMSETRIYDTPLHLSPEGAESGSRLILPGTILIVVRGMSLAKEFRMATVAHEMAFNQDLKALEPDGIDSTFLFHSLLDQRDGIRELATEASHGTKKLDTSVLERLPILVPDQRQQRFFRETVAPFAAQRDNLYHQNTRLRAARDLLLPRLMSGQIAV